MTGDAIPDQPPPEDAKARQQRQTMRVVMTWWAIIGGLLFIAFGRGYTLNLIPVPYLGGIFIAVGILAMCGVNVFWGGPLDKRHDRPRPE